MTLLPKGQGSPVCGIENEEKSSQQDTEKMTGLSSPFYHIFNMEEPFKYVIKSAALQIQIYPKNKFSNEWAYTTAVKL